MCSSCCSKNTTPTARSWSGIFCHWSISSARRASPNSDPERAVSGALGVWNLDGRPVDPSLLGRMSVALKHRGPDGEDSWISGPVGLAAQLFRVTPESVGERQPAVSCSGTVLVFDGRLDNREELVAALPGVSPGAPDTTLVLAAHAAFGDRFPERLN